MSTTTYDHLHIIATKGKKKIIQYFAAEQGKSLNAFVNEAIDEKIERELKKYKKASQTQKTTPKQ